MAMRTILPQDFYIEMFCDGEYIGNYVVMHDCDGRGKCGYAAHSAGPERTGHVDSTSITLKCEECGETGIVQQ